ncbi:hypothetical protein C3B44_10315 [Corynebacterium yudongzhengii]|uniref:Phenol hydroxylase n=1 Tax=Corynebacterium yudongzhengii TaxID=2080740 RepID=A0A2U1T4U4_9CORY|nr:hypothetical protein [Corynebacterium yudongzhengii]AWB82678.1 hypothetical protein C3B44_10315 [Corynebacterium yudongzhengii]PWC01020.1 hypothetical protein DF222_09795 [Corynebacterium yudongzhengii]
MTGVQSKRGETGSEAPAEDPSASGDAWLDAYTPAAELHEDSDTRPRWRRALTDGLAGPLGRLRTIYNFLATTPGKMAGITVLLSVAIIAAGYSMSDSSAQRQEDLDVLLSETEPLSYAAHNLYTNLSLADSEATSSFVRSGTTSEDALDRYYSAIDRAAVAATQSATGVEQGDPRIGELVTEIQRDLPVYTAMVEIARTNAREGHPIGVTYMANASALMRNELLPAASELFQTTSNQVAAQQEELTTPQWIPLSGLVAAIMFLVLAQWWLWRTTGRRLNRGFLFATVCIVVATLWVSTSNFMTWQAGFRGFQEASQPWDSLTNSRILAQQAQTRETLTLLRRESSTEARESLDAMSAGVTEALDDMERVIDSAEASRFDWIGTPSMRTPAASAGNVEAARQALDDWDSAHARFEVAIDNGDYDEAAHLATTLEVSEDGEPTSAAAAARLDRSLSKLIDDARLAMRTFIADGLNATTAVATVVLVLAFAAVLSVWLGIRARLQEYL